MTSSVAAAAAAGRPNIRAPKKYTESNAEHSPECDGAARARQPVDPVADGDRGGIDVGELPDDTRRDRDRRRRTP